MVVIQGNKVAQHHLLTRYHIAVAEKYVVLTAW